MEKEVFVFFSRDGSELSEERRRALTDDLADFYRAEVVLQEIQDCENPESLANFLILNHDVSILAVDGDQVTIFSGIYIRSFIGKAKESEFSKMNSWEILFSKS